MPLYEYECDDCESVVEVLVRGDQEEQPDCPTCGEPTMTRVMSVTAAPAMQSSGGSLPVTAAGEPCGAPRCCGGGCDL